MPTSSQYRRSQRYRLFHVEVRFSVGLKMTRRKRIVTSSQPNTYLFSIYIRNFNSVLGHIYLVKTQICTHKLFQICAWSMLLGRIPAQIAIPFLTVHRSCNVPGRHMFRALVYRTVFPRIQFNTKRSPVNRVATGAA